MLNLAICDDDILTAGNLEMLLEKIAKENIIDIDIDVFIDGEELINAVERGNRFDIIYLDIKMKKKDGIISAKSIRKYDKNTFIVYVTNYENYMKSAFDVRPFRFLLKPIKEKELVKSFLDAYEEILSCDYYFRYRYNRVNYKLPIRDIIYFESKQRKIKIVTMNGTSSMYGKLNDIEQCLKRCKNSFLRVHQSYLVNYRHIMEQAYGYVVMSNSKQISISEERRKRISEAYCMKEGAFYADS